MAKAKTENQIPEIQKGELSKLLKEYRTIAGYSVSQMADALCLSEKIVIDLEDEEFEGLAQPPYIRGYLRNYAKIAGQEPDKLIQFYESLRGADPQELEYNFKKLSVVPTRQRKSLSPILIQVFFLVLLLGIIAGIAMIPSINSWIKSTWESFSSQESEPNIIDADKPFLTGTMPVPTPLPPIPDFEKTDNEITEKNTTDTPLPINENDQSKAKILTSSTATNQEEIREVITPETKVDEKTIQKPVEDNKQNIDNSSDTINVQLVFNQDVWMRIKDGSNKTVFEGLNQEGNSKSLDLKKPLTFRIGNASGLSLMIDNKVFDISSYIKGSVANFTLE